MERKPRWPIVVIILAIVSTAITVLCIVGIIQFSKWLFNPYIDNNGCDEKLVSALETSGTVTLEEIVDVEFEKAYIGDFTDAYLTPEQLLKKHDLKSVIELQHFGGSDTTNSIMLVKDGVVVGDIYFASTDLVFDPAGVWISPDTPLTLTEHRTNSGADVYFIAVDETEE